MIQTSKNSASAGWGIEGYRVPTNTGLLFAYPKFGFSKDKTKSIMEKESKLKTWVPEPGHNHKDMSWKSSYGKVRTGKIKTFLESVQAIEKAKPSPSTYNPKYLSEKRLPKWVIGYF